MSGLSTSARQAEFEDVAILTLRDHGTAIDWRLIQTSSREQERMKLLGRIHSHMLLFH
jgi:hypothetical protein